ncbi:MAG: transcription termination/antitermination protein NusA [Armatimonadetes bacterium 13_1_40CM_3_65_7]|uniref:Transcription termination/antitermination protein NusA n=1 Tax=Candidatus Segetimicrobium genomatis TaxID=2569760 RepID=A0A537LWN4_9BACT|nr:MAG: transcription termination/antitermination protein NusA [Armatimonadetes bacterium 13_1_40CM_3_65_7]TMJ12433.1 MAG: transcription termination/antitermination protein NusA [Terrabacteria group bacterium ANGP1]
MNVELMKALEQIEEEKGIGKEVIIEAIEAALLSAYKKNYGASAQNMRIEVDRETGEMRAYQIRTIVETVEDEHTQISLTEAQQWDPSAKIGDMVEVEVTPRDFGRIAAQTAKQVVVQRLREAERDLVYKEFRDREGDIVTGTVQRIERKNVYLDLGRIEAVLPPTEQIPRESYRQSERIKAYVVEVRQGTRGPQIVVSRTHPGLLKRLFELEVPEIYEGIVEIKAIAREAGARSKFAVASRDKNVDAVGACVGPKGTRVQSIVDELKGEKIDIVSWNADPALFVGGALSPAKVTRVELDEATKTALVIVPDNQLSLAIGREGQNARLAAKLTGWRIDIKSETQIKEIEAKKLFVDLPEEEPAVLAASPAVDGQAGAEASGEATSVPEEPAVAEAQNGAPAQAPDVPTPSGAEGAAADGEAVEPVAASEAPADPDHATKKTAEADA